MKSIDIDLNEKSYSIMISSGSWSAFFDYIPDNLKNEKALIITDRNVYSYYFKDISAALDSMNMDYHVVIVPPGEKSKDFSAIEKLYTAALDFNLNRRSFIIALGGGVIGDLAGFVASTYMRGIPFIQIPTTLLAQVDSSIGGKVAVNHPMGKNIIGAFHQPKVVLINTDTLRTLPPRELSTGMAELIKYGLIYDQAFLKWLDSNLSLLMALDSDAMTHAIQRSCQIKASIVEQDEEEFGLRKILNFGHTIGHAIESTAGYGKFNHGEAVALGMVVESYIALQKGLIDERYIQKLKSILNRSRLPVALPNLNIDSMIDAMRHDKKNIEGKITFVLPVGIGQVEVFDDITIEEIKKALLMAM